MKTKVKFAILAILYVLSGTAHGQTGFNRDLYVGMQNDSEVSSLQSFLSEESLYTGPITGNYGPLTQQAVRRFQSREGIAPVSGYFGPLTRERANIISSGTVENPPVQTVSQSDTLKKIQELLALIENLKAQLAILQGQTPINTTNIMPEQNTQTPSNSNTENGQVQNQVAGAAAPVATSTPSAPASPVVLTPKIEATTETTSLFTNRQKQLVAVLKISNLDENMILYRTPVTADGMEVFVEYKSQNALNGDLVMPKGQEAAVRIYINTPATPTQLTVKIADWILAGQQSGDYRQYTGLPLLLNVDVKDEPKSE